MSFWPRFRESSIRFWHKVLVYDTKPSRAQRAAILARREQAREGRLANDEKRKQRALIYKEVRHKVHVEAQLKQIEWERAQEAAIPRCRYCGGNMVPAYRKPNEASGCIVLLIGLLLAPILIGIPIIIFGIMFMSKSEKYMKCGNCGCS